MSGVILVFLMLFILQAATGYWWWVLVVPFLCGAFRSRTSSACFRSSALGAGLLWMIAAVFAFLTDSYQIATQVATMGGIENPLVTVAATTLVAAVAGGIAGLAGFQVKAVLGGKIRFREVHIDHPQKGSARHHDRRRTEGEDQQDRTTAISSRAGGSRTE